MGKSRLYSIVSCLARKQSYSMDTTQHIPHKSRLGSTLYFDFDSTPGHISHCPNSYFAPCKAISEAFKSQPPKQKL